MTEPTYTAEGNMVFHKPIEKTLADGKKAISLGFQVATVSEFLNDGAAEEVADLMNKGEKFDVLLNALRRIAAGNVDHSSFAVLAISDAKSAIEAVGALAA